MSLREHCPVIKPHSYTTFILSLDRLTRNMKIHTYLETHTHTHTDTHTHTHTHTHTLCEWSLMCMTHYLGVKLNLAETPIKHPHTHTPAAHISNRLCVCVLKQHAIVYPIIFRVS